MRQPLIAAAFLLLASTSTWAAGPDVEKILIEGRLAEGEKELVDWLAKNPADDQARFGLGTLQFVRAIENFSQSLYFFGALGEEARLRRQVPLLRLPVPENPRPEKISYDDFRRMLENLVTNLAKSEATLAEIKDEEVKLRLRFGLVRLDVDGDGKADEAEKLWQMYAALNRGLGQGGADLTEAQAARFIISFDYADVHWLRGYCHLLSAMCEYALLYDEKDLFNATAHQFFAKPSAPAFPRELLREEDWIGDIADAIAAIHLARFPVKEAERGEAVHKHLLAVIELSRKNWDAIEAETDDDNEWVPNPKQTGVIPGVRVTPELIAGWREALSETEAILSGKKLVPHWRLKGGHGVNVRRVILDPPEFDLVLWAHGSGLAPYLEEGDTTSMETWNRIQRVFGGQFIGFAFWFN